MEQLAGAWMELTGLNTAQLKYRFELGCQHDSNYHAIFHTALLMGFMRLYAKYYT
jgi:hypothetical protein